MGVKPGTKISSRAHLGFKLADADTPLLEQLPGPYKKILVLSKTRNAVGIAADLNIAMGTVKSRLNRARTALAALRNPVAP